MKLATIFNHEELCQLQTMVVLEMWNKIMHTGVGKRKLNVEFSCNEIIRIKRWQKTFHRWNFVDGIPREHMMTPSTYQFLQRVCNFFGTYQ